MRTLLCLILLVIFIAPPAYARRGCCSHHGGVAGCDQNNGRQICNDGSYSPSCMCGTGANNALYGTGATHGYSNQSFSDLEAQMREYRDGQKPSAPNKANSVKQIQDPNVVCGTDSSGAAVCELLR